MQGSSTPSSAAFATFGSCTRHMHGMAKLRALQGNSLWVVSIAKRECKPGLVARLLETTSLQEKDDAYFGGCRHRLVALLL